MKKIKLTKVEKAIIELMDKNENYSIHRCDEHGVFAKAKPNKGECPRCKLEHPEFQYNLINS